MMSLTRVCTLFLCSLSTLGASAAYFTDSLGNPIHANIEMNVRTGVEAICKESLVVCHELAGFTVREMFAADQDGELYLLPYTMKATDGAKDIIVTVTRDESGTLKSFIEPDLRALVQGSLNSPGSKMGSSACTIVSTEEYCK